MAPPQRTVIVVHGIGQQAAGATAKGWIESFLRFFDAQDRRAEVVQNHLTDATGAASAIVRVGAPGTRKDAVVHSPVLSLRVVEARWADAFVAPTALGVLRWLLWQGPNISVIQAVLSMRATRQLSTTAARSVRTIMGDDAKPSEVVQRSDRLARRTTGAASALGPLVYLLGGLVLLAVAGPLIVALVLLALLTALVPIAAVKRASTALLAQVSSRVGDVTAFLTSLVDRGAMEGRIEAVIRAEVAAVGREHVHVVAHSQGAALTHAVLARMEPGARPARLTTVGGAHGRLHDMRVVRPAPWTALPILVCALTWSFALPIYGRWGGSGLLAGPGAVSVVALAVLWFASRVAVDRVGGPPTPGAIPGVRWLDLWAPFDPVPNGRPVAEPGPEYVHQTVPGRMAFLLDHVYYEKDWTETVPRVLAHVTTGLGTAVVGARRGVRARKALHDPGGTGPNWTPWSRRDWVSFGCRGTTLVIAVVLAFAVPGEIRSLGTWVRGLSSFADTTLGRVEGWWCRWRGAFGAEQVCVPHGADRWLGFIVLVLVALVVANVAKAGYQAAVNAEGMTWARSLSRAGAAPVRWSVRRWTVVGGLVVVLWAVLVTGMVWLFVVAPWPETAFGWFSYVPR